MEIIKEDSFRKLVKKGELRGGYLFFGEEDYMKSHSLGAARAAVCSDETFALFNDMRIDVLDYSAGALLNALMPLPMMSEQKIVSVSGLNISALKASELEELCDALEALKEYDYNVLIISVPANMIDEGNLPKAPSATLKKLGEYLTLVRFESVSGARLVSWVAKHFEHRGVRASAEVCSFLINYAGRSMYTLANETDKLAFYVLAHGRDTLSVDDVKNISIAEISTDAFALANAILDGKSAEALEVLGVMKFRRIDPVVLLSEMARAICDLVCIRVLLDEGCNSQEISDILKMNEYKARLYASGAARKSKEKLKNALDLCAEADFAVKQSDVDGYEVMEKLVCSL